MKHLFFALLCFSLPAQALDFITTKDGGHITGVISQITQDTIVINTDYAGEITLQRDKVTGFSTQQTLSIRFRDDSTTTGQIEQQNGLLHIQDTDQSIFSSFDNIIEGWKPTDKDPQLVRVEAEQQAATRQWHYQTDLDLAGKEGNSDEFGLKVGFTAELKGQADSFKIYTRIHQAEQNGEDSSDEIILGSEYNADVDDIWGWYLRAEFEKDEFENLDLRSLLGAGLTYRLFNNPPIYGTQLRAGLAYRHERFQDGTTEQSPSLDLGLDHYWQFAEWGKVTTKLTYTPAVDDLNDYLINHDTGVEFALSDTGQWQLKLGLENDYNSLPAEGRKHLDTSYYSRLQLKWE